MTVSTSSAAPTQAVHIGASVVSDYGGSVSLFSNGKPLTGCQQMPVTSDPGCTTVSLPAGTNVVTAVYNGDAEFGKSVSTPARVQLAPLFGTGPTAAALAALPGVPLLRFDLPPTSPASESAPLATTNTTDGTPDGLDLWAALLGREGYGWAGILAGVLFMILGGAYMLVTWVKDEQLKRRVSRP